VAQEDLVKMIHSFEIKQDDFVWKKGFESWKKLKEVPELLEFAHSAPLPMPELPQLPLKKLSLKDLNPQENLVFLRIGNDRGSSSVEYGPYSVVMLKRLFKENRINGKTEVFIKGSEGYLLLGDLPDFQEVFEEVPPMIQDTDRRKAGRKPFIARLFVQNDHQLYEGVCRDISIGGMQVLVDFFKGKSGDKISLNVHPENSSYHFTASGVVVRILEGQAGFSFRFNPLSDEAKRAIEKYLKEN
jgi:hypothetical protein